MSEPSRLHKLYILFPLVRFIKALVPFVIILWIRILSGKSLENAPWLGIAIVFLSVVLLAVAYGYVKWKRYTYILEDSRILIRKGILFRDELSIYTGRIHSLNIEQPLLQRIFGITQVRIETPGAKEDGSVLPAVTSHSAESLQKWLRERTQAGSSGIGRSNETTEQTTEHTLKSRVSRHNEESDPIMLAQDDVQQEANFTSGDEVGLNTSPSGLALQSDALNPPVRPSALGEEALPRTLMQLSNRKLLTAALTSPNLSLVLAFVGGLISFADDLLPDRIYNTLLQSAGGLTYSRWSLIIVAALVVTWLLSGVLYTLKYAGFTVEQIEGQIAVSCGLLEKKRVLFSPERVLAVTVKEGVLRRWFGYAEVRLHVLTAESDKQFMLHPLLKTSEVHELLQQVVPKFQAHSITASPPPRAIWMYLVRGLIPAAAGIVASIWYFGLPGLWALLLLPTAIIWGLIAHRDAGMNLSGKQLTIRGRLLAVSTRYIRRPHIVALKVSASRMQRRRQLLSMKVNVFSSEASKSLRGMEQEEIEAVWRWYQGESHVIRTHGDQGDREAELNHVTQSTQGI